MSTFLERALVELELLGLGTETEEHKSLVAFAKCCDANERDANLLRMYLYRLQNSMPLSALTGSEDEWETVDGVVRNKRCHRVVKEGEVCYDKEAIIFYTLDENGQPIKSITEESKVEVQFPYVVKSIYQQTGE